MPRLTRLPSMAFGWYYVVLRAVPNTMIVAGEQDLAMLLKTLRVTLRERGARLHAAYVAANQVRLALQLGEGTLSAMTGDFQHEYARIFNRAHRRQGSLFRRHHHALLFQHQRWLVPLVHHIHWVARMGPPQHDVEGCRWSSDSVYLGIERRDWLTTNVVLRMLARGAYSRQAQMLAYRALMDRRPEPRHVALFERGCPEDPRLLGGIDFVRHVWRITGGQSPERSLRARPLEGAIPVLVRQVIERFVALCHDRLPRRQAAMWEHLVTFENLRSRSRRRPLPMVRALSVSYLMERGVCTLTQAARFFGCGTGPISARRRQGYSLIFQEWFGTTPESLLWSDALNGMVGSVSQARGTDEGSGAGGGESTSRAVRDRMDRS